MSDRQFNRTASSVQNDVPTIQQIHLNSGGTAIVVIAMFLFSVIILYVTSQNADSAPYGIVGSVVFFLVGTPIGLLAVNGGLADMFSSWQEQRTIRQQNSQQAQLQAAYYVYGAQQGVQVLDPAQALYAAPTEPVALPQSPSFVPAVPSIDHTVRVEAENFVMKLFDSSTGRPLGGRITPNKGQIQYKSPSDEAVEYLVSLGIITHGAGKQLYWSPHFPTLQEARNAIRRGRKAFLEEGKEQHKEAWQAGEVAV